MAIRVTALGLRERNRVGVITAERRATPGGIGERGSVEGVRRQLGEPPGRRARAPVDVTLARAGKHAEGGVVGHPVVRRRGVVDLLLELRIDVVLPQLVALLEGVDLGRPPALGNRKSVLRNSSNISMTEGHL